jgi:hypothetical protein
MTDLAADDPGPPPTGPRQRAGYLTLVARLWIDGRHDDLHVRGSLTDAHTGAQLPLDLTALVSFLRTSLRDAWDEPVDRPPY